MLTFREFLNKQLKDPEFKKEYDALKPEFDEIRKQLRAERERKKLEFHQYRLTECRYLREYENFATARI